MKTRRDDLSNLMYSTLSTMPDASLTEKCDALATIALAHAHLAGADDRLAAHHQALREQALTRALGEALKIVEQVSLDLAADIATDLEQAVTPLDGPPLDLSGSFTLTCPEIEIVKRIPEPPCILGPTCVHRMPEEGAQ